ncbi:hypothetical protein FOWG_18297 [Fusarium oxysporum f. sp. lycopersici MN25]|nr:hypothetical protein FOWG_18297 [Fusarium oxysporum f. sp. lycopersici MN25]
MATMCPLMTWITRVEKTCGIGSKNASGIRIDCDGLCRNIASAC